MLRALLPALMVVFTFAIPASAQIGIYGEANAIRVPGQQFSNTPDTWYTGFSAGIYANLLHVGPARAGLDLRGGYGSGDHTSYRSFLVGPRIEVKPPLLPLRPYVQAALGFGGPSNNGLAGNKTIYENKLQYGIIGGIDFPLLHILDLRLPEIQYLRESAVSSSPNTPALNLFGVAGGVVLRLP